MHYSMTIFPHDDFHFVFCVLTQVKELVFLNARKKKKKKRCIGDIYIRVVSLLAHDTRSLQADSRHALFRANVLHEQRFNSGIILMKVLYRQSHTRYFSGFRFFA